MLVGVNGWSKPFLYVVVWSQNTLFWPCGEHFLSPNVLLVKYVSPRSSRELHGADLLVDNEGQQAAEIS